MRDQDATNTVRYHTPYVREQLSSPMAVERRGRLVKNDEMERSLGDSEGPCHLNHLAFAYGEVADDSIRRDAVVGQDLVEFAVNERPSAAPPTPSGDGRVKDTRLLSNGEIGTQGPLP